MSVIDTIVLPGQGATGSVRYVPLGGNGYTAPHAMFQVRAWAVTGDASGGTMRLDLTMDDRYCSLMAYASMTSDSANDPSGVRWVLQGARAPQMFRANLIPALSATINAGVIADTYLPPVFVTPGESPVTLSLVMLNEDTKIMQMHASIYVFNINARQKVPMHLLVAARGGV